MIVRSALLKHDAKLIRGLSGLAFHKRFAGGDIDYMIGGIGNGLAVAYKQNRFLPGNMV